MKPVDMNDKLPECHEGPKAFERFDAIMSALLAVPKTTLFRRQKAYRKKVEANPNRRGPKRKTEVAEDQNSGSSSLPVSSL
jgi:hypothetical protein